MPRGTGEGDNLKQFCLLPFEEWEKVADRPDEGTSVHNLISDHHAPSPQLLHKITVALIELAKHPVVLVINFSMF